MPSDLTHLLEVRELEVQLGECLLAFDYAQKQQQGVFAAEAAVAAVQDRLDQLRGAPRECPERRAAWLAHLATLEECQIVHDGPAAKRGGSSLAATSFPPRADPRPLCFRTLTSALPRQVAAGG